MTKENKKINKVKPIYTLDNFEQCGKDNFAKLALSALEILTLNNQAYPSIDN